MRGVAALVTTTVLLTGMPAVAHAAASEAPTPVPAAAAPATSPRPSVSVPAGQESSAEPSPEAQQPQESEALRPTASAAPVPSREPARARTQSQAQAQAQPQAQAQAQAGACDFTLTVGVFRDCTLTTAAQKDTFTFDDNAAETVLLRVVPVRSAFAPRFEVRGPGSTGQSLCTFVDDLLHFCRLPGAGTYTVTVQAGDSRSTGDYRIALDSVQKPSACSPVTEIGFAAPFQASSLARTAALDCYALPSASGTVLRATVRNDIPSGYIGTTFFDSTGKELCPISGYNTDRTSDCTLAGTAPFRAFVFANHEQQGTYSIHFEQLSTPSGCTAVDVSPFGPAPALGGSLQAGFGNCYTFKGASSAVELVRVVSAGSYFNWEVRAADGTLRCSGPSGSTVHCQLGAASTSYTLVVLAVGSAGGDYAFSLHSASASTGCTAVDSLAWDAPGQGGTIAAPGQVDCYQFAGGDGARVRVLLASLAGAGYYQGSLENADGSATMCLFGGGDCTLRGPGPFKVFINGQGSQLGSYALRLNRLDAQSGCTKLTPGAFGGPPAVSGVIAQPYATDCYRFDGAGAGVELVRTLPTSGGINPNWEILNQDGTIRCTGGNTPKTCVLSAVDASYTLLVHDYIYNVPGGVGGYTLGLWNATDPSGCGTATDLGIAAAPQKGTLSAIGQVDCLGFAGAVGDVVRVRPYGVTSMYGQVVDAHGTAICNINYSVMDCTLRGYGPFRLLSYYDSFPLPTGSYEVYLARLNAPTDCPAAKPSAFGTAPANTVALGTVHQLRCLTVTETGPQTMELFRAFSGGNMLWELLSSTGVRVCAGSDDAPALCQLPQPGAYTAVLSVRNVTVGSYGFGWWRPLAADGCPGVVTSAFGSTAPMRASDGRGEVDCGTVAGHEGDSVRFRVTALTPSTYIDGQLVNASGAKTCTLREGITTCLLRGPAPYRIITTASSGSATNSYELRAWQLNNPGGCLPVDSVAYGFGPVEQTLSADREAHCFLFSGEAGDQLDFKVANLDAAGSIPSLEVVQADGTVVCSAGSGALQNCRLQKAGAYALLVNAGTGSSVRGRYRLEATCLNPACGTDQYTVAGLSPKVAGAGAQVTVAVRGKALGIGDTVRLTRSGFPAVTGRSVQVSEDRRALSVTFDLSGAAAGLWNLEVKPQYGAVVTVPGALTVQAVQDPLVKVGLVGLNRFVPGRTQTLSVSYENTGNVDAVGVPVVLTGLPAGTVVTPRFDLTEPGSATHAVQPWDQKSASYEVPGGIEVPIVIGRVPASGKGTLDFAVTIPVMKDYTATVVSGACFGSGTAAAPTGKSTTTRSAEPAPPGRGTQCLADVLDMVTTFVVAAKDAVTGPCAKLAMDVIQPAAIGYMKQSKLEEYYSFTSLVSVALDGVGCLATVYPPTLMSGMVVQALAWAARTGIGQAAGAAGQLTGMYSTALSLGGNCLGSSTELPQHAVSSLDPNELVGPSGKGSVHAIRGDTALDYAVHFENLKTATAPAQEVRITDRLDPAVYDLSTLRLGGVTWGHERYQPSSDADSLNAVVDLRPRLDLKVQITGSVAADGTVSWLLKSLDPATGELPEDPDLGFLPPDQDGVQGQGAVFFQVGLKAPVSGRTVTNRATVVFDLNPAISTNTWSNLIDRDAPTSRVTALPATTANAVIPVSWTGSDPTSRVDSYSVYVSVDGAPYALWADRVAITSAKFQGKPGHSYAFRSAAHDLAGNDEPAKTKADATIRVVLPALARTKAPVLSGKVAVDSRVKVSAGGWSPVATSTAYRWYLDGKPVKGAVQAAWTPPASALGHKLTVTVTASRSGYTPAVWTSPAHVVAKGATPKAVKAPTVSGTAKAGKKLTVKHGTWSVPGCAFRYQWRVNGVAVKGATKTTFKLTTAMRHKKITVKVTATRPGHTAGTATTKAVKVR
ncbi:hypothetical protein ACIQGZ_03160 [Streptomyces sp. NPDC092296]|uniref:hypothetical protein n=1 Tax=Streptomyces sp. NPDC092296 TaxID=3366012 RepID=UPI0037FFE575